MSETNLMNELLDMLEVAYSVKEEGTHTIWSFPFTCNTIILHHSTDSFESDDGGYLTAREALTSILEVNHHD